MWLQVGGLIVGMLSVAGSANWLSHTRVRRVTAIRNEAELLAALPEGPVRERLSAKIERDVLRHLRTLEHPDIFRGIAGVKGAMAVAAICVTVAVGGLVASFAVGHDEVLSVVTWSSIAAEFVSLVIVFALMKFVQRRWDQRFPETPWDSL